MPWQSQSWEALKYHAQIKVREVTLDDGTVLPYTKGMVCPFLSKDKQCVIYDVRPFVCRDFGTRAAFPCPYITPQGKRRTTAKTEKLLEQTKERNRALRGQLQEVTHQ
jgi:Fe-S-cluster containining protein